MLETISLIVSMLVGAIGVTIAALGLQTWRQQLRGTAEYDLARRVMRAVLEVRDKIAAVRHPVITPGEKAVALDEVGSTRPLAHDESAEQLVYERRWNALNKARSDLRLELLEAEVLWGPVLKSADEQLGKCVSELFAVVFTELREKSNSASSRIDEATWLKRQAVFYSGIGPEEKDEFANRVNAAVNAFVTFLAQHLGRRTTFVKRAAG